MHVSGIPIADVRHIYPQVLMGGIDEVNYRKLSTSELRAQWDALRKARERNLFLRRDVRCRMTARKMSCRGCLKFWGLIGSHPGGGIAGNVLRAFVGTRRDRGDGGTGAAIPVPALMLGETAQKLLEDVFELPDMFKELPRVRTRVVAWGAAPVSVPHSVS